MNALNVFVVDFKQILSVLLGAFNHTQNTKFIIGFPNIFTSSIIPIVSFFLEKHVHQQCLKAFFYKATKYGFYSKVATRHQDNVIENNLMDI